MQRRRFNQALTASTLAAAWPVLYAQAWPDKPVKWVVSQPAGSGPDNVARILAERLSKSWGQALVIDNKPGGQNTIGAQAAARAPADGYNYFFGTTAALVTNPLLFKSLPYDPAKDFVPVAFIARSPFAIMVRADAPVQNIDELVARSKAAAGRYTLGNEGPRTFGGMLARVFNARTQAQASLVPYASVGVGNQDLLGGHVDAIVTGLASVAGLVKQGRMRVLAVSSQRRVPGWEAVPALNETLPGLVMEGWQALVAPTGTPQAAIERCNRDLQTLLNDKDVAERVAAIGPIVDGNLNVAQVGAFLRDEALRWAAIAKEIGVLPE